MVDILETLRENVRLAKALLKIHGETTFVEWNEENSIYPNSEDAPWIDLDSSDNDSPSELVVKARYNEEQDRIEVLSTPNEFTQCNEEEWYSLIDYAHDISYWTVLDMIGEKYK